MQIEIKKRSKTQRADVCFCVCESVHAVFSTCRDLKSRWWEGCSCSDLGALLGQMIKRPRGGKDTQTKTHSSKHSSRSAVLFQCKGVPLYSLHRKMMCEVSFLYRFLFKETVSTSKLWKKNQCPFPSLPSTSASPLCALWWGGYWDHGVSEWQW